jgi:hypothetical protein
MKKRVGIIKKLSDGWHIEIFEVEPNIFRPISIGYFVVEQVHRYTRDGKRVYID